MSGELMTAEIPRCPKCDDEVLKARLYPLFAPGTFLKCGKCGGKFLKSNYGKGYFLIEQGK